MSRWIGFTLVVLAAVAAIVVGERRNASAPVSPAPLLYAVADTERELSRMPVRLTRLSDEEEIAIGDRIAAQYDSSRFRNLSDDQKQKINEVATYVSRVGLLVAAHAHRKLPYKFHYIPEDYFLNAFALPGGHVFIGAGLIALMDSEDELACVLGHEVEHIDHYHAAERAQTEMHLRKLGPLGDVMSIPIAVFQMGYSKDQELEADREGTRLATQAGYSAEGAVRMFETFDRLYHEYERRARNPQQEVSQVALDTLSGYFRSHPPAAERIAQIRKMMADEHLPTPGERDLAVGYIFWVGQARQAFEAHEYDRARALSERALREKSTHENALRILADSQFALADFEPAASTYRRLLQLSSDRPLSLAQDYADALYARGHTAAETAEFQHWIETADLGESVEMAGLGLTSGDPHSIEYAQSLKRGLLDPQRLQQRPELLARLGWWYYRAGNYTEAVALLSRAAEMRPASDRIRRQIGWAQIELHNYASAIEDFNRAGAEQERHDSGAAGQAVADWQSKGADQALSNFGRVTSLQPEWKNPKWVRALYPPDVWESIAEIQAEQARRLQEQKNRLAQGRR